MYNCYIVPALGLINKVDQTLQLTYTNYFSLLTITKQDVSNLVDDACYNNISNNILVKMSFSLIFGA